MDAKSDYRAVGEYPGRFITCSATTTYAAVQSVSYSLFVHPNGCGFISTGPAVIGRPLYAQYDNDRYVVSGANRRINAALTTLAKGTLVLLCVIVRLLKTCDVLHSSMPQGIRGVHTWYGMVY